MTILEAFKSMIEFEYTNDNLFTKILTDQALTASDTYVLADEEDLDMCLAELCLVLSSQPDFREGGSSQTWSSKSLLKLRQTLYNKWGSEPPELSRNVIDGTEIW